MLKVLTVTVKNNMPPNSKQSARTTEFEELNKLLEDGWGIRGRESINSNTSAFFSVIFFLEKTK